MGLSRLGYAVFFYSKPKQEVSAHGRKHYF